MKCFKGECKIYIIYCNLSLKQVLVRVTREFLISALNFGEKTLTGIYY